MKQIDLDKALANVSRDRRGFLTKLFIGTGVAIAARSTRYRAGASAPTATRRS